MTYRSSVKYTIEPPLQEEMEKFLDSYHPDYGAFVALDASTGKILSLVSYTHRESKLGNLALRALFPAASVFKVVTATAAIDRHQATADTVVAFNGANHTLYKRNVTEIDTHRWARRMTLREAFAKSVNTVFGRLGVFTVQRPHIEEYARRFLWNETIPTDVPVQSGRFMLPGDDNWALAEVASGYNRVVLMSPLQGAMIAAAIANDGVMMAPYLVDSLNDARLGLLYGHDMQPISTTMTPASAKEMRELMRETVNHGTSRRWFRTILRRKIYADLDIGGKTGSLEGEHPRGRTEWFVGYVTDGNRKIAMAALTVNEHRWTVKSSSIAAHFIEKVFRPTDIAHGRSSRHSRQSRRYAHINVRG